MRNAEQYNIQGHGKLHDIYASVAKSAKLKGWDGVDLVIIGGDFQVGFISHALVTVSRDYLY